MPYLSTGKSPFPVAAGVILSVIWIALCLVPVRRIWQQGILGESGVGWQMLAGVPVIFWAIALKMGLNMRFGRFTELGGVFSRGQWWLLVSGAALVRLMMIDLPPIQSDDLYRYIWEGRVQWAGFNPYALPPASAALAPLRDNIWPLINHPQMHAIYPPLAQWSFMLVALVGRWIGSPILIVKLAYVLCDLGVLWALGGWLARRRRSRAWAALWAFHPLVIWEFAGNGHVDSLMIVALVSSLWAAELAGNQDSNGKHADRKFMLSLLSLTASGLAKLVPLPLAPFYMWTYPQRRWWVLIVPVLFGLAYLPYAGAGLDGLSAGLSLYGWNWSGNAPAFELIHRLSHGNGFAARRVVWAGMALLLAMLWLRRMPPAKAALPLLGYYLVVGPMVHPWYLTVILPLVAVGEGAVAPWLWLTLTLPLTYLNRPQTPPVWVDWIIWLPFWVLILRDLVSRGKKIVDNGPLLGEYSKTIFPSRRRP